jgi:hypothetical protein
MRPLTGSCLAAMALVIAIGCAPKPPPSPVPERFASAEQVEENFRGKMFVLGDNSMIALVRPPDWPKDKWLKLPFWFGINVLVPGVLQPKQGEYYVISEAVLDKQLTTPGEWIIEAGSSLVKRETVLVTTRTHYLGSGKILPTIVQFSGMRDFTKDDGTTVTLPVLTEVSLPMKWTLGGSIPQSYARYRTG